jgi:hypothetical protein
MIVVSYVFGKTIFASTGVGASLNKLLSVTARTFDDRATAHTMARIRCRDRKALQKTNCGGREVYCTRIVLDGLALPILKSSKGRSKHKRRLSTTHRGSKMLAKAVGKAFSRNDNSNWFPEGRARPRRAVSGNLG